MIRTLIVDDELYAREELMQHLAAEPDIELLGAAANAIEALPLIQRLKPDVVFLDIQMPKLSGMELVAMLDPLPRIVFVTAFDEYAIQAFEENAFDSCSSRWSRRVSPRRWRGSGKISAPGP